MPPRQSSVPRSPRERSVTTQIFVAGVRHQSVQRDVEACRKEVADQAKVEVKWDSCCRRACSVAMLTIATASR
jgi:hypothetical protein